MSSGHIPAEEAAELSLQQSKPEDSYEFLERRFKILYEAIEEIAFYGTSRPAEMGSEDDGDGWYKRIAYALIGKAAIARRQCR